MKRTIICIVAMMLITAFCVGCAVQQQPAAEPSVQPTEQPTATPAPTLEARSSTAPTPKPEYEIILKDAPEDFIVDERYIPVPFADDLEIENITTDESDPDEPIMLEDVVKTVMPSFTLYYFEDADGQIHYRAYGEKWLAPDGTELIECGIYAVTITRATMDLEMKYSTEPDAHPIPIEQDFPPKEADAQSATQESPQPSPIVKPTQKPADGASSNSSGSSASGGNQGGGTPALDPNAGKIWHDAVYEDVWVVDEPARTVEEPVYETREISRCTACGANITGSEASHVEQHMLNGENGNWKSEVAQVQTGTKTVNIPEKGHWEKKLIREAGYY